jgi:hypothetical protein
MHIYTYQMIGDETKRLADRRTRTEKGDERERGEEEDTNEHQNVRERR